MVNFLLVDDRKENLLSLEGLLKREGLTLLKAHSGTEALELLLQHDIALALVDVQMPEMDGFQLAEIMRGSQRTKNIPIIFVTASNADQPRRFRGYEAGAVDFISKPIEPAILRSKANIFFDLYLQRQEVASQRDQLAEASAENARLLNETREYARALKEADQRKNEFLATLSHELRNPMTPLQSGLEILQKEPDKATRKKIYDMIGRELNHMVALVNDLLDISRISEGKINLQREPLKLKDVVQFALESNQNFARIHEHEIELDIDDDTLWADADPVRLVQVVSNLINNAVKYTPKHGKITVSVAREDNAAAIRVKDTGAGIPRNMLSQIFELFTQIDSTSGKTQGGLGIGLSLARKLVQLHSGEISAESEGINCGSTFTVRLPTIDPPSPLREESRTAPEESVQTTFSFLVVDDNVDAANAMAMLIELEGHRVNTAYNGEQAVKLADEILPDVILLDIGLPDISGYDVARNLRTDPRFNKTFLIAQTGWGQQRDKKAAHEAGFDHHFTKPVRLKAIMSLLQEKLDPPADSEVMRR